MPPDTSGFTPESATRFSPLLEQSACQHMRAEQQHNRTQLAGFIKHAKLALFLRSTVHLDDQHGPQRLAPHAAPLHTCQQCQIDGKRFQDAFINGLAVRKIKGLLRLVIQENNSRLCSQHPPHFCRRRLVLAYLNRHRHSSFAVEHLY